MTPLAKADANAARRRGLLLARTALCGVLAGIGATAAHEQPCESNVQYARRDARARVTPRSDLTSITITDVGGSVLESRPGSILESVKGLARIRFETDNG
jgi:hypothetical protein